jgi:uncharacterized membrane protein YheB (UPF0754 family)
MSRKILVMILIPLISALVGWGTNYIAIRMIFRPRKPVKILGLTIIGLIPKRRHDLALKIAHTVEAELISHKDLENIIKSPKFLNEVYTLIADKIEHVIRDRLASNPFLSMLIGNKTIAAFKEMITDEISKVMPGLIDDLFMKVETDIDFKQIIQRKIEAFELDRLESIVYAIAARELKAIEMYGGVIGGLVGIVQVGIIALGNALR